MDATNTVIDLLQKANTVAGDYANFPVATVNNHVIRMAVMTEPFYWHAHPNSDESFLVIEGSLWIDLEDRTIELLPGQLFTVPRNVVHRTRPGSTRSVNLTFEAADMETVRKEERV